MSGHPMGGGIEFALGDGMNAWRPVEGHGRTGIPQALREAFGLGRWRDGIRATSADEHCRSCEIRERLGLERHHRTE